MKKIYLEIIRKTKKIWSNDYIKILSVFSFFFITFSFIYFFINKFISLDDPFFHIRFAEILRERGFSAFHDFHWIYFSKISENQTYFIYYNFLFYLVSIPFTFAEPLFLGIKLFGVACIASVFTLLYYFLLRMKERFPFLWVVALFSFVNYGLIARFLAMRPYTLAPALLLLLIYFLYQKKYWKVFFLSFIYLYWHTATFFLPLGVSVIYCMFDGLYQKKLNWKIVIYSAGGIALGISSFLLFAPGFFSYMKDIIFSVFWDTAVKGNAVNISEGGELYPYNMIDFMQRNSIVLGAMIIAVVFEIYQYIDGKKNNVDFSKFFSKKQIVRSVLFFLSIGFLLGTLISRRNGDFFIFFSMAYIAMNFNNFANYIRVGNTMLKKSLILGSIITIAYLFLGNSLFLHEQIASTSSYDQIQGAAEWLKQNTSENEIVFNASWDYFPTLFYYNTHNYYVAGIEPRFLYDYNPNMYWGWANLTNGGYVCPNQNCDKLVSARNYSMKQEDQKKQWYESQGKQAADMITTMFKSHYIITSKNMINFNDLLDHSSRFQKVYSDTAYNYYLIYKVVES